MYAASWWLTGRSNCSGLAASESGFLYTVDYALPMRRHTLDTLEVVATSEVDVIGIALAPGLVFALGSDEDYDEFFMVHALDATTLEHRATFGKGVLKDASGITAALVRGEGSCVRGRGVATGATRAAASGSGRTEAAGTARAAAAYWTP